MEHGQFLFQAMVYLAAAVIAVPLAKRLGLGSVLGYLVAGVAIGPVGLGMIGAEGQDVMHFAEFGVVMMLFLIGLELQPALLWRLRAPILGLGNLQVAVTTLVIGGFAIGVGLDWREALAIGMTLSLSSTAIVLQTLNEKGLIQSAGGQRSFAVLLFQDIAVIPMLALLPLLGRAAHDPATGGQSWRDGLPGWASTLIVAGAVVGVVLIGRFVVQPAFRAIARTHLREVFTAAALLLVVGIAELMTAVGLSPALGTFLAGVVLANSEFRHELESDIEPFKGLLLGVFFIAVGASIDFRLVAGEPLLIAGLVGALVAVKFSILLLLGRLFRVGTDQSLLFALALAQGGEFCFVLFSFAEQSRVLGAELAAPLVAVVALSMMTTPLVMWVHERLIRPRIGTRETTEREADRIEERNPVIIAGFGRFGHIVGRLLAANGVGCTVLDVDSDQVDVLRRLGFKVFYGDASRHDLLRAAGAEHARLLVLATDQAEKRLEIVSTVQKHFPQLTILAR
ncbi:MAG TPA: monovalent cation:proton antiporter-2 (CPA2) family protein, partial [Candidatus Polarisedimenticolaceae bacterium]|nr:monovalent cation:proton antiporter-2 (CPA2) family protein [Candidatus Polarisedimenticolaceae bacterium]